MSEIKEYTVTVLSENKIGVLNRVTGIYLRHKINLESLRAVEASIPDVKMMIISSYTTEEQISLVVKQIKRIVEVFDARYSVVEKITPEAIYGNIISELKQSSQQG